MILWNMYEILLKEVYSPHLTAYKLDFNQYPDYILKLVSIESHRDIFVQNKQKNYSEKKKSIV